METTLGELIDRFFLSLGESYIFMSEGALKIVTFDWMNLVIGELFFTGLIIWMFSYSFKDIKESWEKHNQEVEEFNEAYNSSPHSKTYKDMVMYFKYKRKSEFKELPEAEMLKILKSEYRKKWKIELWFNQFIHITAVYWIALFFTAFVSLLTGKFN